MLSSRGLVLARPAWTMARLPRRRLVDASARLLLPAALGPSAPRRSLSLWGFGGGSKSTTAPPPPPSSHPAPTTTATTTTAISTAPDTTQPAVSPSALASPPASDPLPAAPPVAASDLDLASLSDSLTAKELLAMPEQLGYLRAIGLDYGWGPTSVMQFLLEHVHIWSGCGWAASIMLTALLLRLASFYPQIRSLRFSARMQEMRQDPRFLEAMQLIQRGAHENKTDLRQRGRELSKMLRRQYDAPISGLFWSFAQIPFGFGLFRIVNGMTSLPVPALQTAGFLWFPDLTVADPYFILPAIGTAFMVLSVQLNSRHAPEAQKKMTKPIVYVLGTAGFVATTFLSAAVNLMTVALGASTYLSALLLNHPPIRRALRLPLLPASSPAPASALGPSYEAPRQPASPPGLAGLGHRLSSSLGEMKKGIADQVTSVTGTQDTTSATEKAQRQRRDASQRRESLRAHQERHQFDKKYKGK